MRMYPRDPDPRRVGQLLQPAGHRLPVHPQTVGAAQDGTMVSAVDGPVDRPGPPPAAAGSARSCRPCRGPSGRGGRVPHRGRRCWRRRLRRSAGRGGRAESTDQHVLPSLLRPSRVTASRRRCSGGRAAHDQSGAGPRPANDINTCVASSLRMPVTATVPIRS